MWRNTYKDFREDEPSIKSQVEAGKGITGCEMHDLHGYSLTVHKEQKKPEGFLQKLARWFRGN